jgi:hypothetical protein
MVILKPMVSVLTNGLWPDAHGCLKHWKCHSVCKILKNKYITLAYSFIIWYSFHTKINPYINKDIVVKQQISNAPHFILSKFCSFGLLESTVPTIILHMSSSLARRSASSFFRESSSNFWICNSYSLRMSPGRLIWVDIRPTTSTNIRKSIILFDVVCDYNGLTFV